MTRQQLYADLPAELREADDVLTRYGRWARGGHSPGRCGSAEGAYRAPQDDEDRDEQGKETQMMAGDVERVRKALGTLPMMTLCVIQWLYVRPASVAFNVRKSGLQPRHVRERHLEGVRTFWSNFDRGQTITSSTVAIRSTVLENACT